MRFFLSKADDVDNKKDLQKVLVQITQNLSVLIRNKSFDLQTIYLPSSSDQSTSDVPNSIHECTKEIEKTINMNVQRAIVQLETDCNTLSNRIEASIHEDEQKRRRNSKIRGKALTYGVSGVLLALFLLCLNAHYFIDLYDQKIGSHHSDLS